MYRDIRVQSIAYNDSMDTVEKIRQEDFYYVDKMRLINQQTIYSLSGELRK